MSKCFYYKGVRYRIKYSKINYLMPADLLEAGLSAVETGIITHLISLPKEWKINLGHISNKLGLSPNTMRKHLISIFSNKKVLEILEAQNFKIPTYDLEEGLYNLKDTETEAQALQEWCSDRAENTDNENVKKVLTIKLNSQNYLINLWHEGAKSVLKEKEKAQQKERQHAFNKTNTKEAKKSAKIAHYNKEIYNKSLKDNNTLKKERLKKDLIGFLSLDAFNKDEAQAIKDWLIYKQEMLGKKLKPKQIDFQVRKITRLKERGCNICECIEKSILMGWQGLFYNEKERENRQQAAQSKRNYRPQVRNEQEHKEILRMLIISGVSVQEITTRRDYSDLLINGRKIGRSEGLFYYV